MRQLEQDVGADSGLCFQLAGAPQHIPQARLHLFGVHVFVLEEEPSNGSWVCRMPPTRLATIRHLWELGAL